MINEETKNIEIPSSLCNSKYACVIVGITGTGKSSTGNSILGKKYFTTSDRGESETSESVCKQGVSYGFDITVVDTPGVLDTRVTVKEAWEKSCFELVNVLEMCPSDGKRCLILVLKYPCSSTEFDKESLNILRCVLGPDFISKFCVIVLTCGESFYAINKNKTIDDWCREMKGILGDLFKECNYRIVLFSNKNKCKIAKQNQVEKLIKVIDSLPDSYTQEHLNIAKSQHKRKLLLSKLPELKSIFYSRLDKVQRNLMTDRGNYENIYEEIDAILKDIKFQEEGVLYEDNEESIFKDFYNKSELIKLKLFVLSEKRKNENALMELQEKVEQHKEEYHHLVAHGEAVSDIKKTIMAFIEDLSKIRESVVPCENQETFYLYHIDYFRGLETKLKQLEIEIKGMKAAIMLKEQTIPIERTIMALYRRYDNAPDTEFKAKTVKQIKLEAENLRSTIKDEIKNIFAEKLTILISLCEEKAKKTDKRFITSAAEGAVNGTLTIAAGAFSGLELLSSRLGVIIASKAGPAACSLVRGVFQFFITLLKETKEENEEFTADAL